MMKSLKLFLANFFIGGALLFASAQAFALCATNPLQGVWKNVDSNTRSITKIDFRQVCNDVIACPIGGSCDRPTHVGLLKVWGACSPTDCAWGETKVYYKNTAGSEWKYYGKYKPSFAEKTVWVRQLSNGNMQAATWTKYTDNSGREDKWTYDTLKKSAN